eukprot:2618551-Rhodomonas_salina.1
MRYTKPSKRRMRLRHPQLWSIVRQRGAMGFREALVTICNRTGNRVRRGLPSPAESRLRLVPDAWALCLVFRVSAVSLRAGTQWPGHTQRLPLNPPPAGGPSQPE